MLKGFRTELGNLSFSDAIKKAKKGELKISSVMIESMVEEFGKPHAEEITVTELMQGDWNCHREVWLKKKFDYYESPEDLYRAWHGTVFHKLLLAPQKNSIRELRIVGNLSQNHKEYKFSGQFDYFDLDCGTLVDVKSVKTIVEKWLPNEHHVVQLNIYAWLAASKSIIVDQMSLHYFDAERSYVVEAPLWDIKKTDTYIRENLIPLTLSIERSEIPPYKQVRKCEYCVVKEKCQEFRLAENN